MIFAFLFPLLGGALPFAVTAALKKRFPKRAAFNLYNSGIAFLTVGSIMTGVLQIYGTTNDLVNVYWVVGCVLVGIALLLNIFHK